MIAAIVHFFGEPVSTMIGASILVVTVFVLALLMISTLRYSSFKNLTLGRKSHFTILIIALLVALIYTYSRWTLLLLAVGYASSGPVLRLYHFVRRKRRITEEIRLHDPLEDHQI
jgi:CDP-diacylglycerol--serine O-phosphatidyltransferase